MSKAKSDAEQRIVALTGDETISEVVARYPFVVPVLQSYGLGCVGCGASTFESIRQGTMGHGMPEDVFQKMMEEVNETIEKGPAQKPRARKDEALEDIQLTDAAAAKVKELMEKDNKMGWGLRVGAIPGGCSGYQYVMDFEEKASENDETMEDHGLKLFVEKSVKPMLAGLTIDYYESVEGAGFKISNPNASGGCGCGQSFH